MNDRSSPQYWVVWCEGGGSPTVKHAQFLTAKQEAQRLARANPGRRFAVLAAALAYQKTDLDQISYSDRPCEWDDPEIPF